MNILLDTNIIIPLEDTSKILDSSFAELRKLSAEQSHCLYIHPMQLEDINRDKNQERREIVLSRLKQYSKIENPPILSDQECHELGLSQSNDNDKVDNNVLFALYRGAAHLLVTNDEGIHRKASKIGLQDKVYRLEQFLLLLRRYTTIPFSFDYTGVKERFLYEIDKNQPFFESLRQSYDGFDRWFQKCAENSAYLIADECFNDFLLDAEQHSLSGLLEAFPCLILLRAYTKMFAVPGVRFGWCMTADRTVIDGLYRAGQPWNVSVIAQACAAAAANEPDWATETAKRIAEERRFLSDGLAACGLTVFPGEANFLLFRSNDTGLHEKLAEYGIMIRNCDNYRGLSAGYYRVAVKTREASKCLLNAIKLIIENG